MGFSLQANSFLLEMLAPAQVRYTSKEELPQKGLAAGNAVTKGDWLLWDSRLQACVAFTLLNSKRYRIETASAHSLLFYLAAI